MSATYEVHDGCATCISDAGRARLAAEQRDIHHDQQRAEILTFSSAGAIVCIAALMIKHLLGAS